MTADPRVTALQHNRREALRIAADTCTSTEPDPLTGIVAADTIAAVALPHLNSGQRWGFLDGLRTLVEQHDRLTADGPTSIRLQWEDADAHLTRDLNTAAARIGYIIDEALDADWNAAIAGTPGMHAPVPAQRVDAR